MPPLALLGPQRHRPTVAPTLRELGASGTVAAVTAGWQEREAEDDELRAHLGRRLINLALHRRSEEVFAEDPELFAAHRERQDRLRRLQELYRLRLGHLLDAARELLRRDGPPELLEPERAAAVEAVRVLDAHHLARVGEVHREFDAAWRPTERPAVARHRRELAALVGDSAALAIAGGHVAVLLNRLLLFDLLPLAAGKPIVAWSAGAMVLGRRIALFHDRPPQGPSNAEVLEAGLGLCPEVLAFPHARRRLRLGDRMRAGLLARRFAPEACVTLDDGARLLRRGGWWEASGGARRIAPDGRLEEPTGPFSGQGVLTAGSAAAEGRA